jgi:hypothetical protein
VPRNGILFGPASLIVVADFDDDDVEQTTRDR